MEMSTADVFKRSINKLHVPFCFELQGDGIKGRALQLPSSSGLRATHAGLEFKARLAICTRIIFQGRESIVE